MWITLKVKMEIGILTCTGMWAQTLCTVLLYFMIAKLAVFFFHFYCCEIMWVLGVRTVES